MLVRALVVALGCDRDDIRAPRCVAATDGWVCTDPCGEQVNCG